jgi:protein transport protein SEC24
VLSTTIIRCRYCRAYLNPYVYLMADSRRWKCNVCYKVNDLPEEACWDSERKVSCVIEWYSKVPNP